MFFATNNTCLLDFGLSRIKLHTGDVLYNSKYTTHGVFTPGRDVEQICKELAKVKITYPNDESYASRERTLLADLRRKMQKKVAPLVLLRHEFFDSLIPFADHMNDLRHASQEHVLVFKHEKRKQKEEEEEHKQQQQPHQHKKIAIDVYGDKNVARPVHLKPEEYFEIVSDFEESIVISSKAHQNHQHQNQQHHYHVVAGEAPPSFYDDLEREEQEKQAYILRVAYQERMKQAMKDVEKHQQQKVAQSGEAKHKEGNEQVDQEEKSSNLLFNNKKRKNCDNDKEEENEEETRNEEGSNCEEDKEEQQEREQNIALNKNYSDDEDLVEDEEVRKMTLPAKKMKRKRISLVTRIVPKPVAAAVPLQQAPQATPIKHRRRLKLGSNNNNNSAVQGSSAHQEQEVPLQSNKRDDDVVEIVDEEDNERQNNEEQPSKKRQRLTV